MTAPEQSRDQREPRRVSIQLGSRYELAAVNGRLMLIRVERERPSR